MKYEGRTLKKNEKCEIYDAGQKFLGVGQFVGEKKIEFLTIKEKTPEFLLKGKKILGCACWWIPVKEANDIKKLLNKGVKKSES